MQTLRGTGVTNIMKLSKLGLLAAIITGTGAHASDGLGNYYAGAKNPVAQVSHCECGQAVCGCEAVDPACGAENCCDSGCDSAFGAGGGLGLGLADKLCVGGGCNIGDPWTLFGEHNGWSAGGWTQVGYHTANLLNFNDRKNDVQLHQAWLYAEKALDTSGGFDLGGRIDYLYGTDAQDTQAFGTGQRGWDNPWDHGAYGHAIPQAYVEAGYGDLSVKVGHFFTIIGWEVVGAPDNFFYSHAYTMYNSEPFTHTGALATYKVNEDITAYGGYVLGWDSGFDDNGDAFLGGLSVQVTDSWNITYATIGGRFGEDRLGTFEKGYMHSIVNQYTLSDKLQYITQSDLLNSDGATGTQRDTFGINQYLIYALSDCWAVGTRFEWWSVSKDSVGLGGVAGAQSRVDIYDITMGLNYRPHANVIIRPEVRYDWARGATSTELANTVGLFESGRDQFTFGMDTIFTF
jgi:hypothetical protein